LKGLRIEQAKFYTGKLYFGNKIASFNYL